MREIAEVFILGEKSGKPGFTCTKYLSWGIKVVNLGLPGPNIYLGG